MQVAIVGLSDLTENEEHEVENEVKAILKKYDPINTTIIYGGAKGVDTIASNTALILGFAIKPYLPYINTWVGYQKRNIEMAKDCDELFCITTPKKKQKCYHHRPLQNHEKTAGCYTANIARKLNKPCKLIVTRQR